MWQVVGQDKIVTLLQRCLEKQCLAHGYLLVGPPHVGKMTLALDVAQALNCASAQSPCGECPSCLKIRAGHHADVQVIALGGTTAEGKQRAEIGIEQIRDMQHAASLPPFEGKHRVFIIDGAESLSNEAANSLLKTLEEPAERVLFLPLATNEKLLPATVVSRCQKLELFPVAVARIEAVLVERWKVPAEKARLLAGLSHGCLGWAVTAASEDSLLQVRDAELERLLGIIRGSPEARFAQAAQLATLFNQNRGALYGILDLWLDYWHDLLLVSLGSRDIIINRDQSENLAELANVLSPSQIKSVIRSIQIVREQLMQNANPQLALEVLMLNLPGKEKYSGGHMPAVKS
ncbi:MAG: DNA polymerase III subunit delta' C-terminal domain-containing protein [Dehalococcoidales bacterium]|nr:DNA polymerase III subunit delta' C-terminal domain-containing protein [Dehalococcoidales bacterium]